MNNEQRYINFDIYTNELKKYFKDTRKPYNQIKKFMLNNGFEHRQYSGYVSKEPKDDLDIQILIEKLAKEFPWLSSCIKEIDISIVKKNYSLKETLERFTNKVKKENDIDNINVNCLITTEPKLDKTESGEKFISFKAIDDSSSPPNIYKVKYFSDEAKLLSMQESLKDIGTPIKVTGTIYNNEVHIKSLEIDKERMKQIIERMKNIQTDNNLQKEYKNNLNKDKERYPENTQDKLLKDKINDYLREIEQTKQQEQNKFVATKSKSEKER